MYQFRPSENWARGGQIIEDHIDRLIRISDNEWVAQINYYSCPELCHLGYGETPLIAAMRCFVLMKLGDEVDIPEKLFIRA